jgi:hypothetical protein
VLLKWANAKGARPWKSGRGPPQSKTLARGQWPNESAELLDCGGGSAADDTALVLASSFNRREAQCFPFPENRLMLAYESAEFYSVDGGGGGIRG